MVTPHMKTHLQLSGLLKINFCEFVAKLSFLSLNNFYQTLKYHTPDMKETVLQNRQPKKLNYEERKSQKPLMLLNRAYTKKLRKWRIMFRKLDLENKGKGI